MFHQLNGTATGSAVKLSPTPARAAWMAIDCAAGAGGPIYVGGPGVNVSNGIPIAAGQERIFPPMGNINAYDLTSIFILGTVGAPYNVSYFTL